MKTLFETVKPKVIKLIEIAEREGQKVTESYKEALECDIEKLSDNNCIEEFLESFNNEELLIVEAIMYIGRDGKIEDVKQDSVDKLIKEYSNNINHGLEKNDKFSIIQTLSKGPLAKYLKDGLNFLEKQF